MGIAQIALDPPPLSTDKCGNKVPQPILASPYTPRQTWEKVPQTILASPYTPGQCGKKCPKPSWQAFTPPPLRAMPIWKQHISKRGFPNFH